MYGIAFGAWGLIAIVPQAIILASIFGVTGIPPTETRAIRSKGEAFRDYQKRVSKFIPLPPKTHGTVDVTDLDLANLPRFRRRI